jgi:hypothetical protein
LKIDPRNPVRFLEIGWICSTIYHREESRKRTRRREEFCPGGGAVLAMLLQYGPEHGS